MLASKLFQLLSRAEVQEIVLHGGKPPCALVNGALRRLSAQILSDEDIIAVLAAARGQEHIARLADGVRWRFDLPSVGTIAVGAGYEGGILKAALRLSGAMSAQNLPAVQQVQQPPAAPPRPPAAAQRARQDAYADQLPPAAGPRTRHDTYPEPQPPAAPARARPDPYASERKSTPNQRPLSEPIPRTPGSQRGFEVPPAQPRSAGSSQRMQPPQHEAYARPASHPVPLPPSAPPSGLPLAAAAPAPRAVLPAGADLLDELFSRTRTLQASDLHVLAQRPSMLRIAGELVAQPETVSAENAERMLLARVPERLLPQLEQQGSVDFALQHSHFGRFRVNVCRQRSGLKLTARPIAQNAASLQQLGLPESIADALHHHQGLIVITGPTGHGKTTTLAALVGILNRETAHHVITVEDPIEYVHETARAVLSQREVGTHTKTFGAALKGALREDPDVIVVGELRDTETVRMALSASETGHLVISTMNTPSAAKAIERLIDLFPPGDQPQVRMTLAGGLRLIISQRLLPTADRKALCVAAEVLPGSTPLWALIRENRTFQIASLQQRGKSIGIIRLDDSLAELVRTGRTTLEIAREYAESQEVLDNALQVRAVPAAVRGEAPAENSNDPSDLAGNLQKRGAELGKQMFSRAGKLFGGDSK